MYPARRVPQAMLMGLLLPLAGCRMLAAPFLLWSPEPTKEVQAVYAYLPNKKVCTLIWVEADTLFEYPNVQLELSEFLNNSLKPQIRGISFVPPRRVVEYQRRNPDWKREHPTAIGARFGAEIPRFSPRQADLLFVVGTVNHKMAPVLKLVYEQIAEPKWVVAFGACAASGGFYQNYAVVQGIDRVIPVDVYIAGCPPRPEAVLDGLVELQRLIQDEGPRGMRGINPRQSKEELLLSRD